MTPRKVIARKLCEIWYLKESTDPLKNRARLAETKWSKWLHEADASIAALTEAGFAIVPVEPTAEMYGAARESYYDIRDELCRDAEDGTGQVYRAMLKAVASDKR